MAIPGAAREKANAPVMMRISREEEHYIGHARNNMTGRARVGFRGDGRIIALDLFILQDNGARGQRGRSPLGRDRHVVVISRRPCGGAQSTS